jgi:hypothetical protein
MGDTDDRLGYDMAFQNESTSMYHFHVADDHPLFRNAILEVIKRHYPDSVVGQSMDLDSAIRDLEKNERPTCCSWTCICPAVRTCSG